MSSLSAGTVSLPVKPDTRGFGAILGKEILGATNEVSKKASEAFARTFGQTSAQKFAGQNKVILSSAADVERASMRVRRAQEASIASDMKLKIADAQLAEARVKYAEGSSKILRAEERLNTAQRAHTAASAEVEAATARLVPIQGRLTAEQGKLATMTERSHTALGRLGNGFRTVGSGVASMAGPLAIAGTVAAALGVEAVKAAGNFESATTRLVTDAGESAKNIGKVRTGLLNIAHDTGLSADEVAKGMYVVSSAGYTYANKGLAVMKAVAEGAKAGFADIHTVGDALTTVLTDFGKAAGSPAAAMSKLIATVSTGKTTLEALAGSLHSVLPNAQAAGLGLDQVLGAMGTLTAEGISADQAAQNLNHSIVMLQSPSAVATRAMAGVGLSALDVAQKLGQRGLTGTYKLLTETIAKHMGPAGLVVLKTFNSSAQATASLKTQLASLPPSLQGIAREFAAGHVTQKAYTKALSEMDGVTRNQGMQFATLVKRSTGFSDALKAGKGPATTFVAQLKNMVGGQDALGIALHLTGEHMPTFVKNVKFIGSATAEAGGHVRGFAEQQKTLNAQMSRVSAAFDVAGIKIGTVLMPSVQKLLPYLPKIADGFARSAPAIRSMSNATDGLFKIVGPFIDQTVRLNNGLGATHTALTHLGDGARRTNVVMDAMHGKFGVVLQASARFGFAIGAAFRPFVAGARSASTAMSAMTGNVSKGWASIGSRFAAGGARIQSAVAHAWAQITAAFGHAFTQIDAATGGALSRLVTQFTGGMGRARSAVSSAWVAIVGRFTAGGRAVVASATGAIGNAVRVVGGFVPRARAALGNLSNTLFSAGVDLVSGLIRGIGSMVGRLVSSVGNLASKAITAAKSVLKINSPSRVFHEIGQGVGEGFVNGIHSMHGHAANAVATLTGVPAMASLPASRVASLTPAATAAGAGGGGMFTGNLYLDSGELLGLVQGRVDQGITRYDLTKQLAGAR